MTLSSTKKEHLVARSLQVVMTNSHSTGAPLAALWLRTLLCRFLRWCGPWTATQQGPMSRSTPNGVSLRPHLLDVTPASLCGGGSEPPPTCKKRGPPSSVGAITKKSQAVLLRLTSASLRCRRHSQSEAGCRANKKRQSRVFSPQAAAEAPPCDRTSLRPV